MKKTAEREVRIWLEKCGFEMISVPALDANNYWNVVVVEQTGALLRLRFADDVLVRGLQQIGVTP